jgi:hypothetical protein
MSASRWSSPTRPDPQVEPEQVQPELQLVAAYRQQIVDAGKDAGTKRSRTSDPDAFEIILGAIRAYANSGNDFTADDVASSLAGSCNDQLGGAFSYASRRGWITCVGVATSRRVARHGSIQRVWRSS